VGRFDERATTPRRGPLDLLKWRVLDPLRGERRARDPALDRRRPGHRDDARRLRGDAGALVWLGHASFLVRMGGLTVLVDPVLGDRIGPVRRLVRPGLTVDELPPIDVVLLTHNHRDHTDLWTLSRLPGGPRFVVPLGNGPVVRGLAKGRYDELDWWASLELGPLRVTLVPARHWSMRAPWDRNDMLWGGFVLEGPEGTLYHSGDTAYFDGFAEIGRRVGRVDWALLPIGAYDPVWFMQPQHMGPEEAVQAFLDLGARTMVAMHWGTFRLTDEPVGEPPERARAAFEASAGDGSLWVLDAGEARAL
jgi:N-acyl-phosphatidylethanolamine-hydrolysing phospholipase D